MPPNRRHVTTKSTAAAPRSASPPDWWDSDRSYVPRQPMSWPGKRAAPPTRCTHTHTQMATTIKCRIKSSHAPPWASPSPEPEILDAPPWAAQSRQHRPWTCDRRRQLRERLQGLATSVGANSIGGAVGDRRPKSGWHRAIDGRERANQAGGAALCTAPPRALWPTEAVVVSVKATSDATHRRLTTHLGPTSRRGSTKYENNRGAACPRRAKHAGPSRGRPPPSRGWAAISAQAAQHNLRPAHNRIRVFSEWCSPRPPPSNAQSNPTGISQTLTRETCGEARCDD